MELLLCAHDASATNRTVTNLNDSGAGSLRDAIAAFAVTGTISLTSAELIVGHSITINGPGANMLTVMRNSATRFRIFHVTPGQTVTIAALTISNGFAQGNYPGDTGGGILNERSTLTVNACVLSGNSATALGGAICSGVSGFGNSASLLMINSTVSGNLAESGGGVANTDLSSNSAQFGGRTYNCRESSGNAPSL